MGQRDVTDDDLSDMFDYTRASPVPPPSTLRRCNAGRPFGERTSTLGPAERDRRVVDDDR